MPSGAKKRKAAKKKKQNQYSHINGDEDRESDVSENRSPKSQERDDEEEEIGEGLTVTSDEKQVEVGESVKIKDDESDKKDDEGSSESSSSNSDDENRGGVENESSIVSVNCNSPIDDSVVGEKITLLIEGIGEGLMVKSDEKQVDVGESVKIKDDEGSSESSSNSDYENRGGVENESSIVSVNCNSPIDDSVVGEKMTLLIEQVEMHNEQSPSNISVAPIQSAVKENGEKSSLPLESDPRECAKREFDDTTPPQYNAPPPNNGARVKDCLVIQPVATPLFPGQKTSWMSCCGLFEVFNPSGA